MTSLLRPLKIRLAATYLFLLCYCSLAPAGVMQRRLHADPFGPINDQFVEVLEASNPLNLVINNPAGRIHLQEWKAASRSEKIRVAAKYRGAHGFADVSLEQNESNEMILTVRYPTILSSVIP